MKTVMKLNMSLINGMEHSAQRIGQKGRRPETGDGTPEAGRGYGETGDRRQETGNRGSGTVWTIEQAFLLTAVLFFLVAAGCTQRQVTQIDLAGEWHFAADPNDEGIAGEWYSGELKDAVILPGSMNSNGKGNDVNLQTEWTGQVVDSTFFKSPAYEKYRQPGTFKVPFWLQPLKHYQGAAWYQKEVAIPKDWKERQIELFLERCHWETRLWVDHREAGMRNSLGTPHVYDLTSLLTPGKHILTICVDNRIKEIDPGINSHSVSDHTQTNWNGIVGELLLKAYPLVNIRNIQIYPNVPDKKITAKIDVSNQTGKATSVSLTLKADGAGTIPERLADFNLDAGDTVLTVDYPMGDDVKLWNEFHPFLYELTATLTNASSEVTDTCRTTFGMREFRAEGRQLVVNRHPVFLRGTLECAIFPKTGYPATGEEEWSRIFRICRAHGLNHMRFHSWCPPEAAFVAADKAGFYLQVECSSWANQSTTIGDGKPFDQYLYEESERMIRAYGNHPSFCMMTYGNEPRGENQNDFLGKFVSYWKSKDNRRIYTSGAGWPILDVNDYLNSPEPRIQRWGEGMESIINAEPPKTDYDWSDFINRYPQPVVSHEIGQWCVYPDFKEIANYDGPIRARNFEIFQEMLKANGMEQLADSFLLASGKLQALCYKADIEAALRTPDMGGFQLLDLHDFPGQGTALVGVLNAFWDEKGYITPEEYSRFCNSTVPLARMKKKIFTNNETFAASVEVAHYGEKPLTACVPEWKITCQNGETVHSGTLAQRDIPLGNAFQLGVISLPLNSITTPEKLTLEVRVDAWSNQWDFWVYPAKKEKIAGSEKIRIVSDLDPQTTSFLQNGGAVLLTLRKGSLAPEMGGEVAVGFSGIFWNTAWTNGQPPHTLGILCDPKHPALAQFPTEYHSNWQWWDAMSHAQAINLSSLPAGLKPVVRIIDDWFTNRPLGLIIEAKVGNGKLLISGVDLKIDLAKRPEGQQLLYSLQQYMAGEKFNPKTEIEPKKVSALFIQ
ncbi:MAG: glycoside hydrolase family 2 TIM barrel-domain containing protein [Mangrovibacterium sp.]|nr:glycoside hydrolase family 2 TIM barrel-domain containing protein [Mangrovibacterium sp.]